MRVVRAGAFYALLLSSALPLLLRLLCAQLLQPCLHVSRVRMRGRQAAWATSDVGSLRLACLVANLATL
jgi:hypothetical protein